MYVSEAEKIAKRDFGGDFEPIAAAISWGRHLADVPLDACLELTRADKERIFNLGYYTWCEQQGTPFELFMERKDQKFWEELQKFVPIWDRDDHRVQRPGRRRGVVPPRPRSTKRGGSRPDRPSPSFAPIPPDAAAAAS